MVQTDASREMWLEERGPALTLIGFQDDATSEVLAARFQLECEDTVGYLRVLREMVEEHGIPLSLYRDRHSAFQRNDKHWSEEERLAGQQSCTHLGQVLEDLGIEQIAALTPQAKGRMERLLENVPGSFTERTAPGEGENGGAGQRGASGVRQGAQPEIRESGAGGGQRFSGTGQASGSGSALQSAL